MRVGFIGCGHIARVHASALRKTDATLVGVTDRFKPYASQFAAEWGDVPVYESTAELIAEARPDAVHIMTPPATHFETARECLEAGCHVLVEKPMAMTAIETRLLMQTATRTGRILSVDHNARYESVLRRAKRIFESGDIGTLISVEVDYAFDAGRYPALLQKGAENSHWIYKLPGGPLEDLIVHPLSFVTEYLDDITNVSAHARNRGVLPEPWDDEIRVLIDSAAAQAEVYVSFGIKPDAVALTLRGTSGTLVADLFSMTVVVDRDSRLPRAATRGLISFRRAAQLARGGVANVFKTAAGRVDKTGGMGAVIGGFYSAIREGTAPPVTMEQGHEVVDLIRRIWPEDADRRAEVVPEPPIRQQPKPTVLVTGATGFVGSHLVETLLARGESVRALVRPSSLGLGHIQSLGCDLEYGDLSNLKDVRRAMEGIEIVYHAGGATGGGWEAHQSATVEGTKHILDVAKETHAKRVVYFSSLVVYDLLGHRNGTSIRENDALVAHPERYGPYTMGKIEAEKLVAAAHEDGLPTTIVRPGIVLGPRGRVLFPHLGFKVKDRFFVILGRGNVRLPLIYIDNLVEGVIQAAGSATAVGRTYNLVDDGDVTVLDYVKRFAEQTGLGSKYIRVPFLLPYSAVGVYEIVAALGLMKRGVTSRRQLRWKHRNAVFSTEAAKQDFGWQPTVPMDQALRDTFDWYASLGGP